MALLTTSFDRESTADDVLSGVDLHGRTALVTGVPPESGSRPPAPSPEPGHGS